MEKTIRLVVADDSPHARRGLCAILTAQPGMLIVGEAAQGAEALVLVEAHQPQVALLDVCMPVMGGIEAARVIKERWPQVRVVLISMYTDYQEKALESGADAFLVKGCPAEELISTVWGASCPTLGNNPAT